MKVGDKVLWHARKASCGWTSGIGEIFDYEDNRAGGGPAVGVLFDGNAAEGAGWGSKHKVWLPPDELRPLES